MSRDWFAVYCRLVRMPKFRRMSDAAQLTLVYAWAIASDEATEATWASLDALTGSLELLGRPPESVTELVTAGWLEVAPDGQVAAHDWDEHQYEAGKDARNRWEAHYMREWRRQRRVNNGSTTPPGPPVRNEEEKRRDNRGSQHVNTRKQRVNNTAVRPNGEGGGLVPLKDLLVGDLPWAKPANPDDPETPL